MLRKVLLTCGSLLFIPCLGGLISVRVTEEMTANIFPDFMRCHERHPGVVDELWFEISNRKKPSVVAERARLIASFRPLCDKAGIALSFQHGVTLGHGEIHDGAPKPDDIPFSDEAWQCGPDGHLLKEFLCPRSPEALAVEHAFVKTVLTTARPRSFWIDDDLRLGICRPNGCFCPRCLEAFNRQTGSAWTRADLVSRLYGKSPMESVRSAWVDFNAESLGLFAAEVRKAADEVGSDAMLAYQSVWSDTIHTGRDYRRILEALSGPRHARVGIRPGAGYYREGDPRIMVDKCLSVAREAERCRNYGGLVATVCYEEENYPRHVLNKSPGAIVNESALALASGCDSLSLYWYSAATPEPLSEYDRFLDTIGRARPYFSRLSQSVLRTRLGGVARYLGERIAEHVDFDLRDPADLNLACIGIPVTVVESGTKTWYLTEKSFIAMTDADWRNVSSGGVVVPASLLPQVRANVSYTNHVRTGSFERYPFVKTRRALLDAFDAVAEGGMPVRIDACRPLRVLPRILSDGRVDSVTILNLSSGGTDVFRLRVRRPVGLAADWWLPGREPIHLSGTANGDELVVELPDIPGSQIGTLFF